MTDRNKRNAPSPGGRDRSGHERDRPDDVPPPPGAGVINSDGSGQIAAENPVLQVDRDAGDVLADEMIERQMEEEARRSRGGRTRP